VGVVDEVVKQTEALVKAGRFRGSIKDALATLEEEASSQRLSSLVEAISHLGCQDDDLFHAGVSVGYIASCGHIWPELYQSLNQALMSNT